MVSEPESKKFGTKKVSEPVSKIFWYWKKSRNRSRKKSVPKKVSESVSKKFDTEKKSQNRYRSDFGSRHTLTYAPTDSFRFAINSLARAWVIYQLKMWRSFLYGLQSNYNWFLSSYMINRLHFVGSYWHHGCNPGLETTCNCKVSTLNPEISIINHKSG